MPRNFGAAKLLEVSAVALGATASALMSRTAAARTIFEKNAIVKKLEKL
jgi:hypothetical protein